MATKAKKSFKKPFAAPVKAVENVCNKTSKSITEEIKVNPKEMKNEVNCNKSVDNHMNLETSKNTKPKATNKSKKSKKPVSNFTTPDPEICKKPKEKGANKETKSKKRKFESKPTSGESDADRSELVNSGTTEVKDKTEAEKDHESTEEEVMNLAKLKNHCHNENDETLEEPATLVNSDSRKSEESEDDRLEIVNKETKDREEEVLKIESDEPERLEVVNEETTEVQEKSLKTESKVLPVRSLTDEEYEEIFQNAIKRATDTSIDELLKSLYKEPKSKKSKIGKGFTEPNACSDNSKEKGKSKSHKIPHKAVNIEPKSKKTKRVKKDKDKSEDGIQTGISGETDDTKHSQLSEPDLSDKSVATGDLQPDTNNQDTQADGIVDEVVENVNENFIHQENETSPDGNQADGPNQNSLQETPPSKKLKSAIHGKEKNLEPRKLSFPVKLAGSTGKQRKQQNKKDTKRKSPDKAMQEKKEKGPKKKQSRKKTMQTREVPENGTWVQCCNKTCSKWRYIPTVTDPTEIPETWICSMNPDEKHNSCDKQEQVYDETEHIFTNFSEGSLVWAKMSGYPWWPAMVEIDPDDECYFKLMNPYSMYPSHYHVVFFDDKVSRAWVRSNYIQPFIGKENLDALLYTKPSKGPSFKKEIAAAKERACKAIDMTVQERIKTYSFCVRFTGKWGSMEDSDHTEESEKRPTKMKRAKVSRTKPSPDRPEQKKQRLCDVEILDDTTMDELIDTSVLEGLDEVLESLESEILTDGSDFDCWTEDEEFNIKKEIKSKSNNKKIVSEISKASQQSDDNNSECNTQDEESISNSTTEKGSMKQDLITFDPQIYTMELDADLDVNGTLGLDAVDKKDEVVIKTETDCKNRRRDNEQNFEGTEETANRENIVEKSETVDEHNSIVKDSITSKPVKKVGSRKRKAADDSVLINVKSVESKNSSNISEKKQQDEIDGVCETNLDSRHTQKGRSTFKAPPDANVSRDSSKSLAENCNSEKNLKADAVCKFESNADNESDTEELNIEFNAQPMHLREQQVPSPGLDDEESQDFDNDLSFNIDMNSLDQKHSQDSLQMEFPSDQAIVVTNTEDSDPFDMEE